mgnify:FL=1
MDHNWKKEYPAAIKHYINKCLLLTWMMVVQDPPMCFDQAMDEDNEVDTSMYRFYVTRGKHLAYIVLPCMLLYKGGPVVVQGVAEGKSN